jgi:beta-glucosidase
MPNAEGSSARSRVKSFSAFSAFSAFGIRHSAFLLVVLLSLSLQRAPNIDERVEDLLAKMTLEEKLGQLQQLDGHADGKYRPEHLDLARRGLLGSTLNVRSAENVNALQRAAVEESRLKIPLIFAFDVIHGYRTVFPIPLGEAAAWSPADAERSAAIAAAEARAAGVHWTFAPMVDIAHDARWGRVAEGAGEDPFLGSALAAARVRGFQGTDYSRPDRVVACAKHWVAYGAAEGGRDYDTVDLSERTLRTIFFPPFKAAIDAGAGTVMSAFNDINGVPASANPFTLTTVLRNEWRFDGLVVSDYTSVAELIKHGVAGNDADAARAALAAGVDMEMVSRSYVTHGAELVKSGRLPIAAIDEAVRRVLRIKMRAGLFEQPYVDAGRERKMMITAEHRKAAREVAARSMVLLKNDGRVLPLSPQISRLAVIGPLADAAAEMMGSWTGDGKAEDVVSLLAGIKAAVSPSTRIAFVKGVEIDATVPAGPERSRAPDVSEAVAAARDADAVILALGEAAGMSGEAASRAHLGLTGHQQALADAILATGRPVVVVLFNGRPLAIPELAESAPAILEAWFPGTEAGHAVADVIFGKVSPGGKLPVTFPRAVGQVPLYYNHLNTGRPPDEKNKYTSKYLDVPWTPLFPFGHGLSYTEFKVSGLQLNAQSIPETRRLRVSVDVTNVGTRAGDEVVQLYVQDVVASMTRPVQELKGFLRVALKPGERRRVEFWLGREELGFYGRDMKWIVEPGEFRLRVSTSSIGGLEGTFSVAATQTASTATAELTQPAPVTYTLTADDDRFLDDLSRRSFQFFWENADPATGIVRDRARTDGSPHAEDRRWVGSIASTGFGLTALCIAADRGWSLPAQARQRARVTLSTFADRLYNNHGWFHHFIDIRTGERLWKSEVSSIDTALFLGGVLTVKQCFADDGEIVREADRIYRRIDFLWMLNGHPTLLSHGWYPERGFIMNRWAEFSEAMILYFLGIGSPTFPLPAESWAAWGRPVFTYREYTYVHTVPPLFLHQYSHAWIDFRRWRDPVPPQPDWFANSIAATRAQRQFFLDLRTEFPGYGPNMWGLTASDAPKGYIAWGGPPRHEAIDGTVVPAAAGGSLMFTPDITVPALREMHRRFGARIYARYGFTDAFNPTTSWVNPDVIGIDVGITLLSAENLRSGKVWAWFMKNPEIVRALQRAGGAGASGWYDPSAFARSFGGPP